MPYGPHSTASDSVRFFTPALAAAECAKPGPPVHAYDAPTLMIEPGVPAREVAAAELAGAEERAVERDVDDGAPRVGRHVLGRHREVGGRVVDEHAGQAERGLGGVEGGGDLLGVADVARRPSSTGAPSASIAVAAGVEVLGLAAGDHDRRAEAGELGRDGLAEAGAAAGDEHARRRRRCPAGSARRADGRRARAVRSVSVMSCVQLPV